MSRSLRLTLLALCAFSILPLAACSTSKKDAEAEALRVGRAPEAIYSEADQAVKKEDYAKAIKLYNEVERQHPYSELATKGQVMAAYAAYQNMQYDEAIIALNRFIELHPGHEDIAYAYYLKALCYYEQISDVRRDQNMTKYALESLDLVITRFPDSSYAREATLKRDLTLDHLAGKEMEVGRYYLKGGHLNAAINRFQAVIRDYQTTTHVPEALYRLVEANMVLGLKNEALRVAVVMGHNFPGSEWYEDAYKLLDDEQRAELGKSRSWMKRTIDSLLRDE